MKPTKAKTMADAVAMRNSEVLEAMRAQGADMGRPVHHVFYFHGPEDYLRAAAVAVESAGLRVIWLGEESMTADGIMVPDAAALDGLTGKLSGIAKEHEVEFDGWEAEVRLKGEYNLAEDADDGDEDEY